LPQIYSNIDLFEKVLDALWLRNEVISNNIANVNTPGFKSSSVVFEDILKKELEEKGTGIKGYITHNKHIPIGKKGLMDIRPQVVINKNTALRNDGNNVDIDNEMAQLTKNTLKYNSIVQLVMKEFSILKNIINEGRR
jgi:flagellar basal-body rod protein FlgB